MSKRYSIFICVLFCAFLGVFAVMQVVTPDRKTSEQENRELEQMPTPVFAGYGANFFSGEFMSKFERYITDQFPFRDAFIGVKAAAELAVGKTVNNGVYFGTEDTLFAGVSQPEEGEIEKRLGFVDALTEHTEVPVYFSLVPNKLNIIGGRLKNPPVIAPFTKNVPLALSVNYLGEDLWEKASQSKARWIDFMPVFQAHQDEELFYRTDHHWTSLGAGYASQTLAEAMGYEVIPMERYEKTTVSTQFLGTTYSSSGASWVKPDEIDIYVPEDGIQVTSYTGTEGKADRLYHDEKLEGKDKYAFFLGGNQPLAVVESETAGPKVLVIRDSYSDALAPFLADWCSEIHLYDARYNNSSIPQYIKEHDIDAVIVLYSMSNFLTDDNLFKLAMP